MKDYTTLSPDELFVELAQCCGVYAPEVWQDTLSLPSPVLQQVMETWRDLDWTKDTNKLTQAIAILTAIAAIAAPIATIAGAVVGAGAAVVALKTLL